MTDVAFGLLGLTVRDFILLTPVEVLQAGREKMNLWHLQNAVNASFFTSVLQSLGVQLKGGEDIKREHLYRLPGEEVTTNYLDPSTEEGRKQINELIKKTK